MTDDVAKIAVETMARALCQESGHNPDAVRASNPTWTCWESDARAVLDALAAQGLCVVPVEGLQRIADATDLYEPCGWAVHSVRAMLAAQGGV